MRTEWTDLPGELRSLIEARTGDVATVEPAPSGNHADLAATLHAGNGPVFMKAARKTSPEDDGPEVRCLRYEAAIIPHVPEFAPRLLWQVEVGGWLALGLEHVQGRHADYTPGSPDLELLAKVVETFQGARCPDAVSKRVERRWLHLTPDVSPMAGDTMIHADLNPSNLLVTTERVYVVDWAFTSRGAAFAELGLLIPWLLRAGHDPAAVETWISRFPSWADQPPAVLALFSQVFHEKWRRVPDPAPWAVELTELTGQWAAWTRAKNSVS